MRSVITKCDSVGTFWVFVHCYNAATTGAIVGEMGAGLFGDVADQLGLSASLSQSPCGQDMGHPFKQRQVVEREKQIQPET